MLSSVSVAMASMSNTHKNGEVSYTGPVLGSVYLSGDYKYLCTLYAPIVSGGEVVPIDIFIVFKVGADGLCKPRIQIRSWLQDLSIDYIDRTGWVSCSGHRRALDLGKLTFQTHWRKLINEVYPQRGSA